MTLPLLVDDNDLQQEPLKEAIQPSGSSDTGSKSNTESIVQDEMEETENMENADMQLKKVMIQRNSSSDTGSKNTMESIELDEVEEMETLEDADSTKSTSQRQSQGRCYKFMTRIGCECIARLPQDWPRSFALIFGVIVPILLLVAIALFFGYFLADFEAPSEVENDNDVIATRAAVSLYTDFVGNLTTEMPKICLATFVVNHTNSSQLIEDAVDEVFLRQHTPFNESLVEDDVVGVDAQEVQDLFIHMRECGKQAWQYAGKFAVDTTINDIGSLSLNWIRCEGERRNSTTFNRVFGSYWRPPHSNITRLRPDAQEAFVVSEWKMDQQVLYNLYVEEFLEQGMDPVDARIKALRLSFEEASGFDYCAPNSDAGAWFWFTVMTTIGYGNVAPETDSGRAMVYTLGFFSILTFALVLGNAGTIVTTIFDDAVTRTRCLHRLSIPWVACIFWGCCYYAWMVLIAVVTQDWKEDRLGEEFEFKDAFWFAYISTTTVGLGDFYLEHEVLLRRDLIVFALLFLFGFVLLANFFVKLTELIVGLFPHNKPTLEESLKASNVSCCPKIRRCARVSSESIQNEEEEEEEDEPPHETVVDTAVTGDVEKDESSPSDTGL